MDCGGSDAAWALPGAIGRRPARGRRRQPKRCRATAVHMAGRHSRCPRNCGRAPAAGAALDRHRQPASAGLARGRAACGGPGSGLDPAFTPGRGNAAFPCLFLSLRGRETGRGMREPCRMPGLKPWPNPARGPPEASRPGRSPLKRAESTRPGAAIDRHRQPASAGWEPARRAVHPPTAAVAGRAGSGPQGRGLHTRAEPPARRKSETLRDCSSIAATAGPGIPCGWPHTSWL